MAGRTSCLPVGLLIGLWTLWPPCRVMADAPLPPFQLPPGFTIERVAGPPLVQHPMMGNFDERGRLFLAESAGLNLPKAELLKNPPNKILLLDEADATGHFRKGRVFADRLTFPMGALWHQGALYTASSGGWWRLIPLPSLSGRGAGGEGAPQLKRQEIVTKFGYTGNAADVHGPFLGPDGRLYWCDGRHGHEITRPDGTVMKGKAARIFRCRPDGSDVEVVCGGGMDNPVEIAFTDEGEPLVTVDILHATPARNDGIIYAIEGGVYPWNEVYKEFPRTGELLPAVGNLGWVAPAGLTRYRAAAFGPEYQGNLFSAQFNRNRIQRHILEREGATFRMRTEDFLVCTDRNFHPTDVFEDADGSLLVIDTGGWFRIGCPTSQIAKPEIKGAIYRIRRQGAPVADDPRGLKLAWDQLTPPELSALLADARVAVRDRAIQVLAQKGDAAIPALKKVLQSDVSSVARRNAVWALTRMETAMARAAVRGAFADKDMSVRLAAVHAAGLQRDDKALSALLELVVKDQPAVRRQAATALGRLGQTQAVAPLMEALHSGGDRFLEHALIYALIRIADREGVANYLRHVNPTVRRGALIALDQMPNGNLTREQVTPLLQSEDAALLQATLQVIAARPGWGKEIVGLVRQWLQAPLQEGRQENLRGLLAGLSGESAIQELMAAALRDAQTPLPTRLLLLETMTRAAVAKLPPAWLRELGQALNHPEEQVVRQAVASIRTLGLKEFDSRLLKLAEEKTRPVELRIAAFAAVAPRLTQVGADLFAFLLAQLDGKNPPLTRLAAASALGPATLTDNQLLALAQAIPAAGALELPPLLGAFEKSKSAAVGQKLLAALDKSAGLERLSPTTLQQVFRSYPKEIQKSAIPLGKRLEVDTAKQKERLAELEPLLTGGDVTHGRDVFFSTKASCAACHATGGRGGTFGPELSKIGAIRSGRDLLEALVFPSASFARGYEPFVIETRTGKVHLGILGRETADAVFLVNAERAEVRIVRSDIETFAPARVSIMPQGLETQLNRQELRDLLAFLQSLR